MDELFFLVSRLLFSSNLPLLLLLRMMSSIRGSLEVDPLNGSGADRAREFSTMEMTKARFKNLYEEMKGQYAALLESHEECKRNLEKSMEDNRQMQDKFKNLLDKLQMDNRKKQSQIEEMKSQLLDNSKIDQIRDRLASEIEGPYKLTIQQLGTQVEQTKGELTRVRLELNARTKEFASELTQKDQILNEIQQKSEKEVFSLRKERDLLQQQLRLDNDKDLNEEQIRTRELVHSKGRIDQLIDELNQLQQEKLHAEQIAANAQRELIKETSMSKTRISLLENERDSLKQQFNGIHQELASSQDQLTRVNRQCHDKDLRLAQLNSELESVQHRLKMDTANHRIDLAKVQREYLEQHEQVKLRLEDLEEKISALNADKSKLQLTIQEKEHQLLTNIQSTREDEWKKISEITNEKLDLEAQVNILKKSQDEREKQFELERDRLIEQIKSMEKSRDELQKDNHQLNSTIKQMNDCQADLEKEQDKCRDLYRKCVKLESQLGSTNGIEQELTDMNLKLKNELNQMVNECHANKQEVHQMNNQCTSTIENARRAFFTERKEMEKKIEHLIEQLKQYKTKVNELQKEKKDYRKKYQNFTQKLAEKSQLIDAKLNEIKQKEMSLQNVVSVQTHNRLKRQLAQLLRKHAQFQDVLNVPQLNQSKNDTNDELDLHTMINRLDRLSHQQNDQLKDFLPVKESAEVPLLRRPITSSSNGLSSSSATSKEKRKIFPLHDDRREDEEEEIRFHSP